MALSQNAPATDSAAELHEIVGTDSTANFENDPTFVDSNPTATGSSENLAVADEDDDDLDEDDEDELDDDEEDEDDLEDEDEEEFDDEDDDDDLDDDDEEDDDAEEAGAVPALRVDGLLGYEDEAADAEQKRPREEGDAQRDKQEAALDDGEDDDAGDDGRENAVDEDQLNTDEEVDLDGDESALDTDETASIRKGLAVLAAVGQPAARGGLWT